MSHRMKLLDPTQDLTEIVGLIYELFYMSAVVDETAVIALFKWESGGRFIEGHFADIRRTKTNSRRNLSFQKNPLFWTNARRFWLRGIRSPKSSRKCTSRNRPFFSSVLIIERICRLNPSFCCSFFLSKPRGEPGDCLGELISLLLESEDLGVQQSVYQILGTLFGRDATMNVAMSDGMNKQKLDDRLNLRQFYSAYFPAIEHALIHSQNTAVNATLLAIELVTAFLPIHQTFLRGVFTAGKLLETLMMKLPMDCVPSVSMVIRCGRNVETGIPCSGDSSAVGGDRSAVVVVFHDSGSPRFIEVCVCIDDAGNPSQRFASGRVAAEFLPMGASESPHRGVARRGRKSTEFGNCRNHSVFRHFAICERETGFRVDRESSGVFLEFQK